MSDASLDLEFRHLQKVYKDLTGLKTSLILIDSMSIDSRRKSLFAKIHRCYQTIGFSDIINHAYDLIGDDLKFCAGDSHTVSRVAAGLAFVDRKVILMGRNPYPPDKPGKICVRRLKENLDILNKAGKLVREDGTYGRLIESFISLQDMKCSDSGNNSDTKVTATPLAIIIKPIKIVDSL